MTTTISKHELQQQQQQQQQLQQQQTQQQQQQQQQRSSILFKNLTNTNLLINNTVNMINNATKTKTFDNSTTTTTTTTRLDSATTIIQIDSLNNNNNNNNNNPSLSTTPTNLIPTTTTTPETGLNNNNGVLNNGGGGGGGGDGSPDAPQQPPKSQKRRSLLNFKSFDFHLKSLYTGLRNGNKNCQSQSASLAGNANGSDLIVDTTPTSRAPPLQPPSAVLVNNRIPPYLKIDAVDQEESKNLLLDYPQSPYSSRRNSSHDDNRSSSQLLHISRYEMSRSQASSPSPYFLSPYPVGDDAANNIRRSSTSDIVSCKRSGTSSASDSRRPSTSDLLRKARERRGSEARMGRSVSHGGLPRGGLRSGCGSGSGGGRRTSMAF